MVIFVWPPLLINSDPIRASRNCWIVLLLSKMSVKEKRRRKRTLLYGFIAIQNWPSNKASK